ncbi:PIG-L deacetylase family protein [Phytomonospora endophytica]|uniref:LmbE family N-acetylglucosaminyl deacetylase n=1 Tax=Phytomonospora endophytica TaxID=714109 RepID=A0A841G0V0_9ACTN|nr:PIG-L deacetylase family protein [Phytomonospora endophytica]MBB6038309.1 LmbE family N-acetylglucosaminyl deacetylase [Phytomonospora endophytica]
MPEPLLPMPADWQRALAIVAHPDDMEYGAAGAVARWTGEGREVAYLMVTRGEAGIDGIAPAESAPLREAEQIASAAVVGVSTVEFLDHRDGVVEAGLPLRRDLSRAIRRHKPELVITLNHRDHWAPGTWNSADHRAVGQSVLDAVGDAGNRWIFPELVEEGHEPWGGVRWVALANSPRSTHGLDITATLDASVASLAEHKAYIAALSDKPVEEYAREFLSMIGKASGERMGCALAASFELITTG